MSGLRAIIKKERLLFPTCRNMAIDKCKSIVHKQWTNRLSAPIIHSVSYFFRFFGSDFKKTTSSSIICKMLPGLLLIIPTCKAVIFEECIWLTLNTRWKSERVFKTMINRLIMKTLTQISIMKTICICPIGLKKCGTKMAFPKERRGITCSYIVHICHLRLSIRPLKLSKKSFFAVYFFHELYVLRCDP